jgi:hypothetical protein
MLAMLPIAAASNAPAQSGYTVIPVSNGVTIAGTVKWSGLEPRGLDAPVNKDSEICDPESHKKVDLERMSIGPDGGVANTIVYFKNISRGKAMNLPSSDALWIKRRESNQAAIRRWVTGCPAARKCRVSHKG